MADRSVLVGEPKTHNQLTMSDTLTTGTGQQPVLELVSETTSHSLLAVLNYHDRETLCKGPVNLQPLGSFMSCTDNNKTAHVLCTSSNKDI